MQFLAQGTLYPDVIESGAADRRGRQRSRLHHNVGGLPSRCGSKLVEPLRDLFKDEVRAARAASSACRKKWSGGIRFPAPAWRCACLGEVTHERLETLREADAIFQES